MPATSFDAVLCPGDKLSDRVFIMACFFMRLQRKIPGPCWPEYQNEDPKLFLEVNRVSVRVHSILIPDADEFLTFKFDLDGVVFLAQKSARSTVQKANMLNPWNMLKKNLNLQGLNGKTPFCHG